MRISRSSRAVAAAGDYGAGDIVSDSASNGVGTAWQFPNLGTQGTIYDAFATCSEDSVVWRLRLHLFKANPSASELDDNAAKAFAEADRANALGYIDFQAAADIGVYSMAGGSVLYKGYETLDGTLYGVVETLDAEANETAGMTLAFTLYAD